MHAAKGVIGLLLLGACSKGPADGLTDTQRSQDSQPTETAVDFKISKDSSRDSIVL